MTQIPVSPFGPLTAQVHGSGPGILLAHGAGGSIEGNYLPIMPALAAGHTVVAPDYPGSGATPRATAPLTLDGLADAVVASATEAGLETFTLVGYSLGTLVSVRAAARHPERVRGLVLTAGLARADNRLLASLDIWRKLLADGDRETFARFVALSGFGAPFFNAVPTEQLGAFYELLAAGIPDGAADQAAVVQAADTTGDLAGISVPTLVVATTLDTLVTPANSRVLADRIPGAEYAEIETGHIPMAEKPEEWSELITSFLDKHAL
ncbi:alpha/beta fold hydrolase [Streptomyces sp. ISL-11]|uniref:alpha/beta fold hydrolase n=1 Tax=Streptomyces sp. ISL-11 TaxID=2819174 RepID=UPI001BE5E549|nr:alpha/beta hydrolase [Streptomyces sp. ISL-11]MBT2384822.1 alpha/beta hydrolase [Streptomyces sp. ISL-11]